MIADLRRRVLAEEAADSNGESAREQLAEARHAYDAQLREHRMQIKNLEFASAHNEAEHKADLEKWQARIHADEVRAPGACCASHRRGDPRAGLLSCDRSLWHPGPETQTTN